MKCPWVVQREGRVRELGEPDQPNPIGQASQSHVPSTLVFLEVDISTSTGTFDTSNKLLSLSSLFETPTICDNLSWRLKI